MWEPDNWVEIAPLGDLLIKSAKLHPNRTALVLPDGRPTFTELLDRAWTLTHGLYGCGLRPGDHIGILAGNNVDFVASLYGISLLGAVAVPLNVRHKPAELSFIIPNSNITALLTTTDADDYVDFAELLYQTLPSLRGESNSSALALDEAPSLRAVISLRGKQAPGLMSPTDFYRSAQLVEPTLVRQLHRQIRLRDVATIIYTSGTTANPKGCMLSHEALTRGPVERAATRFASGVDDVHWGAGPLFHIGSLAPMLGALGAGCTYVTDKYFDPEGAVELMVKERVTTIWPWFTAIVQGLLEQPSFHSSCLTQLKSIVLIGPTSPR